MERLAKYVHVAGELWRPGQAPPEEVADLIPNPKAWADEVPVVEEEPEQRTTPQGGNPDEGGDANGEGQDNGPDKPDATPDVEGQGDQEDKAPAPDAKGDPERPAKSAPVDEWRKYIFAVADVTKAEVDEMTKADLVDAADQLDADE